MEVGFYSSFFLTKFDNSGCRLFHLIVQYQSKRLSCSIMLMITIELFTSKCRDEFPIFEIVTFT